MQPEQLLPGPFRPTDSPWFWGCAFGLMALVGMALIAPKFAVRQRQIEGRFLGRQQAAIERSRRAAGMPAIDLAEEARDREVVAPGRIVPLWTLATAAGLATLASAAMLRREWLAASRSPPDGDERRPPDGDERRPPDGDERSPPTD